MGAGVGLLVHRNRNGAVVGYRFCLCAVLKSLGLYHFIVVRWKWKAPWPWLRTKKREVGWRERIFWIKMGVSIICLSLPISAHSTKSIPSLQPTHNPKAHQIVGVLSAVRRDV